LVVLQRRHLSVEEEGPICPPGHGPVLTIDPGMNMALQAAAVGAARRFAVMGPYDKTVRVWLIAAGKCRETWKYSAPSQCQ
jgi:hypothetical protein